MLGPQCMILFIIDPLSQKLTLETIRSAKLRVLTGRSMQNQETRLNRWIPYHAWIPSAEVAKTASVDVPGAELSMEALGALALVAGLR